MSGERLATVRELWGENASRYELSVPVDVPDCYAVLLEKAASLVRGIAPESVTLSGITWREVDDEMVLNVCVTRSPAVGGSGTGGPG